MMKPTAEPWKNDSMKFSAGWRCVVTLPDGRAIDVADPRNRETSLEDVANAELTADGPTMLRLLAEVRALWILRDNPNPKSTAGEILALLKKYGLDKEPEYKVLGTADALLKE